MTKVITYGTYDLLHYGHIKLLERAKKLGDYLIVGVTSDDFDRGRGKINVQESLMERVANVKATGLADMIIIEEYEGQKIDDIKRYGVDIFTVGSDWKGHFDYLNEYCKVQYLERTKGISSSKLRSEQQLLSIGLVGNSESRILKKYCDEFLYVNGAKVKSLCTNNLEIMQELQKDIKVITKDYDTFLDTCDAVYIISHPSSHYQEIKKALLKGKHVLCESPISLTLEETKELFELADKKKLVLMEAIKTAYSMAYNRLILLAKSGRIGKVVSVDTTCTSLLDLEKVDLKSSNIWNSITSWGPTAMLPIFDILGTDYEQVDLYSQFISEGSKFDLFTKANFKYRDAVASFKVGRGIKSEGNLVISGTKGYIYVPAPWWKTDYFELRYENPLDNKRYFYKLDGEGIRFQLVSFLRYINTGKSFNNCVDRKVSFEISKVIEKFYKD
ncbi:Bifunctional protein HldE [Fusobacterium sp. DD29]|uniref:Gfo/Idh/MocA family oxidoreductase n=1 Tax=unclassified Fusobacterium TaxID=2648384 RepID=UPI001B8D497C|nr:MULTISPECIES: Gfo/Idh/MocA family oxidoreductase [unclassified Fusobacterium]MBR8700690.1 Bifunctional protein HldE [Fusobacterium sp. DD45]MBR8710781.1 Bifunctional protein HldE [Fusobacterium sp. DD28]MBR8748910.1 Bifunctional protein HldE [Fusobacterium sp. DD29]MBR8751389.1 Bifunctional protein HldE [Fusobacterium sp. DD26]MBR8761188.1 Bifunctional protein HldE [Fusobacterium sp. DD25]